MDDWQYLVRLDGEDWPYCQDAELDDTEPDTWSVTFSYGRTPPEAGRYAVERLACEWVKGMVGRDDCELPQRVQTMTRQGITATFLDPMEFLDNGRIGLLEVDAFLKAYNPNGISRRGRLYRADALPQFRRVGT